MGGRFVVFGGGMERESAGPVDWMERRDTGKEFESGGGQQSLFNCAAVAGAASCPPRGWAGGETGKRGVGRGGRRCDLVRGEVRGVRASLREPRTGGPHARSWGGAKA